jgi:DNA-binding CsgD family transcriptional regulator
MNFSAAFGNMLLTILEADTPQQAVENFFTALAPFGVTGFVYSSPRLSTPLVQGSNSVQRWVQHFANSDYFAIDPLYRAAQTSVIPQFWHAGQSRPEDHPEQARIYQELKEFGIAKGFDLSIHDYEQEGALCFYFEDPDADMYAVQHIAQLGGIYLHERARQLVMNASNPGKATLTNRERECLLLVQQGLTYAQIGQRLAITERTVTFHLQNAKQKLQVSTLAQAVSHLSRK